MRIISKRRFKPIGMHFDIQQFDQPWGWIYLRAIGLLRKRQYSCKELIMILVAGSEIIRFDRVRGGPLEDAQFSHPQRRVPFS